MLDNHYRCTGIFGTIVNAATVLIPTFVSMGMCRQNKFRRILISEMPAFSTLRAYALSDRNVPLLLILLMLSLVPLVTNLASDYLCNYKALLTNGPQYNIIAASKGAIFVHDPILGPQCLSAMSLSSYVLMKMSAFL